jgi:small-conductance mechanosensitive channel
LLDQLVEKLVHFSFNVAIAVIVFYIGRFIINKLYGGVKRMMLRRQVDKSLTSFTLSFVKIVLYFILIVTVIGILGIETSSFLALFASAGVAIGMALSGTLQNFAGGVLILFLKPYRIGDYIEAQGFAGTVKEIQIFHTVITTPDNKAIIIPNGGLSTGSVNNYSREDYRRVDWQIGISYGDDVDVARKAILAILAADSRIVKQYVEDDREMRHLAQADTDEPAEEAPADAEQPADKPAKGIMRLFKSHRTRLEEWQEKRDAQVKAAYKKVDCTPTVLVSSLDDNAVTLCVRAWTQKAFYWGVYHENIEAFYKELPKSGINFPFPQLDVHFDKSATNEK